LKYPPGTKGAAEIIEHYVPDYLFLDIGHDHIKLYYEHFTDSYEPIQRFSRDGLTDLHFDLDEISQQNWTADYVLYKRKNLLTRSVNYR
jgi:hypothetical protein